VPLGFGEEMRGSDRTMDGAFQERLVVTAFLSHEGRVLVLRRSERVSTYQGRWAGVSGTISPPKTPVEQALTEIAEETSLSDHDVTLLASGEPLHVEDAGLRTRWVVHPFLFAVENPDRVRLDWEHVEASWVRPEELEARQTVPGLVAALEKVLS